MVRLHIYSIAYVSLMIDGEGLFIAGARIKQNDLESAGFKSQIR